MVMDLLSEPEVERDVISGDISAGVARQTFRERVRIEFANTPIEVWPHSQDGSGAVPEPLRILLPRKNECKRFIRFVNKNILWNSKTQKKIGIPDSVVSFSTRHWSSKPCSQKKVIPSAGVVPFCHFQSEVS
jgi:hypothetical protein